MSRLKMMTFAVAMLMTTYGTGSATAEEVTAPSSTTGTPNNSVTCGANGLFANSTYNVTLRMKLTESGDWFDVGATSTHTESTSSWSFTENVAVTYNPGPGTYSGKGVLRKFVMGQGTDVHSKNFNWQGPNM